MTTVEGAAMSEPRVIQSPRSSRRTVLIVVLVVVGVLVAGGVVLLALRGGGGGGGEPPAMGVGAAGATVEAAEVERQVMREMVRGVGTLRSSATVEIRPEVSGRVRAIRFEEGSAVEEGQVLFEVDDEKLRRQLAAREAALRAAEARAEHARRTLEQHERIREYGGGSEFELERVQMELAAAVAERERLAAEVELGQEQLRDAMIRAPFAGVISERRVDVGGFVSVGESLATLYRADPLEIAFSISDRYMGRIRRGQEVSVEVGAFAGERFSATVDFVSPAVDEGTRMFLVKARVRNEDGRLKPGAFATALVTVGEREAAVIPEESLVATRQGYMVFVIEEGVSVGRHIETGLISRGMVEVVAGLEPGEQVVQRGHMRLRGGERVEIVNADVPDVAGADGGGEG